MGWGHNCNWVLKEASLENFVATVCGWHATRSSAAGSGYRRARGGSTCGMHFLPLCGYVLIVSLGKPQDAVGQHGCAMGGRRQDDEGTTTER